MATDNKNRHALKITIPAGLHLKKVVQAMKDARMPGATGTRVASDVILSLRIPGHIHNGERKLHVAVDYCPKCAQVQTYHNGHCHTCGTSLLHMTAIETEQFVRLMHMVNVVAMRKNDRGQE